MLFCSPNSGIRLQLVVAIPSKEMRKVLKGNRGSHSFITRGKTLYFLRSPMEFFDFLKSADCRLYVSGHRMRKIQFVSCCFHLTRNADRSAHFTKSKIPWEITQKISTRFKSLCSQSPNFEHWLLENILRLVRKVLHTRGCSQCHRQEGGGGRGGWGSAPNPARMLLGVPPPDPAWAPPQTPC